MRLSTDKWIEVMDAFMARKDEWPEVNYPIYIYQPSLTSGAFDGMFGGETTSSPLPLRHGDGYPLLLV
ncbi:MAG: hypothetical protein ACLR23_19965 [Clostridia bacterium]